MQPPHGQTKQTVCSLSLQPLIPRLQYEHRTLSIGESGPLASVLGQFKEGYSWTADMHLPALRLVPPPPRATRLLECCSMWGSHYKRLESQVKLRSMTSFNLNQLREELKICINSVTERKMIFFFFKCTLIIFSK